MMFFVLVTALVAYAIADIEADSYDSSKKSFRYHFFDTLTWSWLPAMIAASFITLLASVLVSEVAATKTSGTISQYDLVANSSGTYITYDDNNYYHVFYWDDTGFIDKKVYKNNAQFVYDDKFIVEYPAETEYANPVTQYFFWDYTGNDTPTIHLPKDMIADAIINQ